MLLFLMNCAGAIILHESGNVQPKNKKHSPDAPAFRRLGEIIAGKCAVAQIPKLVIVIAGNDKGKTGKVLSVDPAKDRAIVEGVNMVSKHTKPNAKQPQGGIIKKEAPIHISNLNLIDPKSGKPTRVGFKVEGDKKVRIAKKSGEEIK
jgi:large subunit ribosomal protein L24